MASVEQQTPAGANGAAKDIAVENPATGQVIGHVPDLGPEQVADLARRGRAAQPAWEALGFEGRGRVLRRAQRWLTENSDRVIDTIVAETGKAWEDAQAAELAYGAGAFGFWAENAPEYLADEKVRSLVDLRRGQAARAPLPAARARRRDRAVELPADELLRRLHPRAGGGQQRDPQAQRGHAADEPAARRGAARVGLPEDVFRSRPGGARRARR